MQSSPHPEPVYPRAGHVLEDISPLSFHVWDEFCGCQWYLVGQVNTGQDFAPTELDPSSLLVLLYLDWNLACLAGPGDPLFSRNLSYFLYSFIVAKVLLNGQRDDCFCSLNSGGIMVSCGSACSVT